MSQETLVMEWGSETRKGERATQDVLSGMVQAGYWNTILLGNLRRQCGAQASGLTSLREGVGVFTHQLLSGD